MADKRLKFLFIQPNSPLRSETMPLGMAYIAAVLKQHNCEVKIIDCTTYYAHYSNDDIVRYCKEFSPDAIGILIMTTFATEAYKLIVDLKQLNIPLIAGGSHPSLIPEETISNGIDIAFSGESEETFIEYVEYLRGKKKLDSIKGISYRVGAKIIHNPMRGPIKNLDALPFPDRDAYNLHDFAASRKEFENSLGIIITSRGCFGRCIFCSKTVSGNVYRFRSPKNIADELTYLKQKYKINSVLLVDDAFNLIRKRVLEICELLKDLKISWRCNARVDFMTKDLLQKMKDSGCTSVTYGIESGDPEVLEKMHKGFTVETAKQVIKWTHEVGLRQTVNFMYGFPFETKNNIQNTINIIKYAEPYIDAISHGGILIPFPGTEVYELYKDKYGFANWWLNPNKYLPALHSEKRLPLFEKFLFKDLDQLNKNHAFFDYDAGIIKQIRKAISVVNKIVVRKKAKDLNFTNFNFLNPLLEICIWALLGISKFVFKISPVLEQKIIFSLYLLVRQSKIYLHGFNKNEE